MEIDSYVTSAVKNAKSYSMDHFSIAWERGEAVIRAMANESPFPPEEFILEAVSEILKNSNLYPEDPTDAKLLRSKIADYCNVEIENITIGNGSMELFDIVFRIFLEPGFNILTSLPDYTAYSVRPTLFGSGIIYSSSSDDLGISVDSMIAKIDSSVKLIILSRPHNPSGTIISRSDVIRLLDTGFPVFIDEAYIELSDISNSVVDLIPKYNNLLISRTFSKGFGLAGFRIGYLIANPQIINYANRAKPSMNVNLLAQTAAHAALENIEKSLSGARKVKQIRQWLLSELIKLSGIKPIPSETNFIMVDCIGTGLSSKHIADALFNKDIFIRDFSKSLGLPPDRYFRITVGYKEKMQKIIHALKEILNIE